MHSTPLGILIMVVSTTLANLAAVLQKRAVDTLPAFGKQGPMETVLGLLRSPGWVGAAVLGVLGMVFNMVALALADISVVQPVNGFGLVVLGVASRAFLKETLTRQTLLGMALIIAGVVLVGATASGGRAFSSANEILDCYAQPGAWLTGAAFLTGMTLAFAVARRPGPLAGVAYALIAAACAVLGVGFAKGFFGVLGVLGVVDTALTWQADALLVCFGVFAALTVVFQQVSFQKGRAVDVNAAFVASTVVMPLAVGRFVFHEELGSGAGVALLLIVAGVVTQAARRDA